MKTIYRCGRCNFKWTLKGNRKPIKCISCGSENIANISDHLKDVFSIEGVDLIG